MINEKFSDAYFTTCSMLSIFSRIPKRKAVFFSYQQRIPGDTYEVLLKCWKSKCEKFYAMVFFGIFIWIKHTNTLYIINNIVFTWCFVFENTCIYIENPVKNFTINYKANTKKEKLMFKLWQKKSECVCECNNDDDSGDDVRCFGCLFFYVHST